MRRAHRASIATTLRTALALTAATAALVALGGCGDSRTPVPSLSQPAAPRGFRTLGFTYYGVTLIAPKNWVVLAQRAPVVTVVASGAAFVAVWRFPRAAPAPTGSAQLDQTRRELLKAVRTKYPGLVLIRASALTVDHRSAVEIDALEQINGRSRRVRSTHVYVPGAEYVLDEYAPPAMFHAVDHAVFSPIKRSLRLRPAATA
ncbi:MAG: hypothetical protein M3Z06_00215 [Actinomycetota bacterium]|nr:hypothetical protein [Actinomycetota bacterium]